MEVLQAVTPLNRLLCDLHGPTESIARTMSRLVPFPTEIGSLPDAELLDLRVRIAGGPHGGPPRSATVEAVARYATSVRSAHIRDFYHAELLHAGAVLDQSNSDGSSNRLQASLPDTNGTRYLVAVEDLHGYRAVKVTVRYANFDAREVFDRFARWHNGSAPVSTECDPTGVEISTFANGRRPTTLVLYSTEYECDHTPCAARRAMVESRIDELGWTYHEPREGIMFIRDGSFEAEIHVLGDELSSSVTFVGEFQLR